MMKIGSRVYVGGCVGRISAIDPVRGLITTKGRYYYTNGDVDNWVMIYATEDCADVPMWSIDDIYDLSKVHPIATGSDGES